VLSGRFSESIQCSYHAWTYALDGSLIGAPFTQEIQDFDRTEYSLIQVLVTTWEGFIFIHLPPQIQSFDLALGNIFDRFLRFNTAELVPGGRITYDVKANWKLIFQNYSECLHCPTLHPDLARLSPFQSGANDLYEGYVLGGYMEISSPGGSMTMTGRACGLPVSDELKPEDGQRVYYYSIFPNMLLSLHPDYVMYHTILPQTPDRSAVTCEWLFHPKSFTQLDFNPADAVDFWDMTNRQDWHICEQSQLGVTSRAYQPGPYAPRESLLAAWDRAYLQALDAYA
jgi:Rieske 2Fe-2S family protein